MMILIILKAQYIIVFNDWIINSIKIRFVRISFNFLNVNSIEFFEFEYH